MKRLALLLAVLFGCGSQAHAQAYQCRAPSAPVVPQVRPDGPARATPVTGYTLALSWSPQFCRSKQDDAQCSGRNGRFGLIVHGLWPEGARGSWPQWCGQAAALSAETVRQHSCMMPSPYLMAHEWAKHGSCMVRRPETYYRVTAILWQSLRLPDFDRLSRTRTLKAGDVRRAWVAANPATPANGIAVITGKGGWIEEIRLCYARDFMPATCSPRRRGAPDSEPVKIWRGL